VWEKIGYRWAECPQNVSVKAFFREHVIHEPSSAKFPAPLLRLALTTASPHFAEELLSCAELVHF
jgi:hypothetical protein